MSFILSKIINDKKTTSLLMASLALAILLYKFSKQQLPEEKKIKQILKLKKQINCFHPTKQHIEKLLAFCVKISKDKVRQIYGQIQKKRSQLKKQDFRDKAVFKKYLNFIDEKISQTYNVGVDEIFGISAQLGISALFLKRHQSLVQQSIRKTVESDGLFKKDGSKIKIEEIRKIMKKQIEWAKKQKNYYVDMMLQCIKESPKQRKSNTSDLYRYFRADIVLKQYPNISTLTYLNSKSIYFNQLIGQYQQLQIAQVHSIIKLNAGLRSIQIQKNPQMVELSAHQQNQLRKLEDLQMDSYNQMNKMIQKANN